MDSAESDNQIEIKPLAPEHSREVSDLHLLIWQEAYAPIFGKEHLQNLPRAESRRTWQERLKREQYLGIGLWRQGELVGFAGWGELAPVRAEIYHFYLHPQMRGGGTASWFMSDILATIRKKDYQEVLLWVLKDNIRARRFYQKQGFVPTEQDQVRYKWGLTLHEVQLMRPIGLESTST